MESKNTKKQLEETMENVPPAEINKPTRRNIKRQHIIGVLVLVVLLAVGTWYLFVKSSPEEKAQEKVVSLVKEVKKIMILPESDIPAVFDIQDPVLLATQQAFFAGAQKGDKLLVYPQIGKAIIYSPEREKIVNVGPVTFDKTNPNLIPQTAQRDK